MTDFLSTISGKFSVSLTLGTLLPVTIFVILARLTLAPFAPETSDWTAVAALAVLDERWEILALTLAVIVVSGLLFNLNVPLIRLYEGYPWKGTWIGRRRSEHYRKVVVELRAKGSCLREFLARLKELQENNRNVAERERLERAEAACLALLSESEQALNLMFPKISSVLPTRLGNVIRSFENHPQRQYGLAAITLWPRLIAKVDSTYVGAIEGAKASFDFMLNCATLSAVLAAALVGGGLFVWPPGRGVGYVAWLIEIAIFVGLAHFFYALSIGRARAWGDLVRGAFDLYRWDLLTQLGYEEKPATVMEERSVWLQVSRRLVYGDPPGGPAALLPYRPEMRPSPTSASTATAGVEISILRAVGHTNTDGSFLVTIVVENRNTTREAAQIVVTDTMPLGFDLVVDSASMDQGNVTVMGINPFHFELGEALGPGKARRLTYQVQPRRRGGRASD